MEGRRGNELGLQAHSPTSGFASSGLFPLISLSHVKPSPHRQHDLSTSNQKNLKTQASALNDRYLGRSRMNAKANLDSIGSIQLLRHISMDLDPRASSMWKKNQPIPTNAPRRDQQEEFFKSYLNEEIK